MQVAPNHTAGSRVVSAGLSKYAAIILTEKKYGKEIMSDIRFHDMNDYVFYRRRNFREEKTLLYADDWTKWSLKAGIVLYGLRDLIGEDSVNAALREFYDAWKFRKEAPYAGVEDLYKVLQKHVPDSFRYYLTDTWEKLCLYDNKIVEAKAVPAGSDSSYRLTMKIMVNKVYIDSARQEHPARGMKDYIDIGVYGAGHKELYLKKLPFAEGEHTIALLVPGKPVTVAIDPERKLIDRIPEDNRKELNH
jgi:ABC-2 type transport system permease protein